MEPTMTTLRVREIMTTEVSTIAASASVEEAARRLSELRISGAPVVAKGRILGVLSKSDLVDPESRAANGDRPTVEQVMTPMVYAVRPADPVMLAVRLMAAEGIHRVVVVDQGGKLVGIVSTLDVVHALARGERVQDLVEEPVHADPAVAVQYVDLRTFELQDGEGATMRTRNRDRFEGCPAALPATRP
jgi:CBS domain-containing protein